VGAREKRSDGRFFEDNDYVEVFESWSCRRAFKKPIDGVVFLSAPFYFEDNDNVEVFECWNCRRAFKNLIDGVIAPLSVPVCFDDNNYVEVCKSIPCLSTPFSFVNDAAYDVPGLIYDTGDDVDEDAKENVMNVDAGDVESWKGCRAFKKPIAQQRHASKKPMIQQRHAFKKPMIPQEMRSDGIVYCPTGQMLADYFTKPLQGAFFRMFREVIMGWKHVDTLKEVIKEESSSLPKERVEGSVESSGNSDDATNERLQYAQVVTGSAGVK
jgi:hypothetical protein